MPPSTTTQEETNMANDKILESVFEQDCLTLLDFVNRINEVIADFYDVYDQPTKSAAEKRYMLRKEGQINGMCEAFEIMFHTRIEWGREGIKKMKNEEVQ